MLNICNTKWFTICKELWLYLLELSNHKFTITLTKDCGRSNTTLFVPIGVSTAALFTMKNHMVGHLQ